MSILHRLRLAGAVLRGRDLATEAKKVPPGGMTFAIGGGFPVYPPANYGTFAQKGYAGNPIVFSCIRAISTGVPAAQIQLFEDDGSAIEDPEAVLPSLAAIRRPNAWRSEFALWELSTVFLNVAGTCFIEKVRDASGRVVELWPMRPDRTTIIPSAAKFIAGYEYEVGSTRIPIPAEDVIRVTLPAVGCDSRDDFFGMSPLRAIWPQVATDNEATDFLKVVLQNFGVPGTVVTTPEGDVEMDEDRARRYREVWHQRFGSGGRGDVMFLRAGADVKRIALNLQELTFADLNSASEARICSAFGVPPIIVGAKVGLDRSTFSNFAEAREAFALETLSTFWDRFASTLALDPDFAPPPGLRLAFDKEKLPAFGPSRRLRETSAIEGWNGGLYKRNEARARCGLPKDETPAGDEYKTPAPALGLPGPEDAADGPAETPPRSPEPGEADDPPAKADPARFDLIAIEGHFVARKLFEGPKAVSLLNIIRAIGAVRGAKTYTARLLAGARANFESQGRDVLKAFDEEAAARKGLQRKDGELTPGIEQAVRSALLSLSQEWDGDMAQTTGPILAKLLERTALQAAVELGVSFDVANDSVKRFVQTYVVRFTKATAANSADRVREVMLRGLDRGWTVVETRSALEQEFASWSKSRAATVAQTETIRAATQGTRAGYRAAEVPEVAWLASSDACAICLALAAKGPVALDGSFIEHGDVFDPTDDAGEQLLPRPFKASYERVEGPPAHPNCVCALVPVGV